MKKIFLLFAISFSIFVSKNTSYPMSASQDSLGAIPVESQLGSRVESMEDLSDEAVVGPRTTVHQRTPPYTTVHRASPPPTLEMESLFLKRSLLAIEFTQGGCTFVSEIDGMRTNAHSFCVLMYAQGSLQGIAAFDAASMKFTMFYSLKHMQKLPLIDCSGRLEFERVLKIQNISFCFPRQDLAKLPPFTLIEIAFSFAQAGISDQGFYIHPVSSLDFQAGIGQGHKEAVPRIFQTLSAASQLPRQLPEEIDIGFDSRGCFLNAGGSDLRALSCNICVKGNKEVQEGIYAYEAGTKTFIPIFDRKKRISLKTMIGLTWEVLYFPRDNFAKFSADFLLNISICLARSRMPGQSLLDQGMHIFPLVL